MEEWLYFPDYIARIILSQDMSMKQMNQFLSTIWENEREFLLPWHKRNKKKYLLDMYEALNYWENKEEFDREYLLVNQDLKALGSETSFVQEEFNDMYLFFVNLRLRILYLEGQDYVRMKLRTLLREYGYKRRTKRLNLYLKQCLAFYHIESYVKGGEHCDIEDIGLDDMITFRAQKVKKSHSTHDILDTRKHSADDFLMRNAGASVSERR